MTEDEWEELEAAYERRFLEEEQNQLSEHRSLISAFKNVSKQKGLILNDDDFRYIERIGIVACSPNILNILNPEIRKDKEGLVPFEVLDQYLVRRERSSGLLYGDDYIVMAHPYFRRGFSSENSFAPRFAELFWKYSDADVDSYVSLDFNKVRIDIDGDDYLEKDTWYGARFNRNIDKISDGVVKLRPPSDIKESFVNLLFMRIKGRELLQNRQQLSYRIYGRAALHRNVPWKRFVFASFR